MIKNLIDILNTKAKNNICTAAVIVRDGKILLGNRIYPKKDLSVWNFPGGRCNTDETIGQALIREVFEEIGIKNKNFKILYYIGKIKGSWKDDVVHIFHCSIEGEPKLMEPEKFKEWRWIKLDESIKSHFNDEAIKLIIDFFNKKDYK